MAAAPKKVLCLNTKSQSLSADSRHNGHLCERDSHYDGYYSEEDLLQQLQDRDAEIKKLHMQLKSLGSELKEKETVIEERDKALQLKDVELWQKTRDMELRMAGSESAQNVVHSDLQYKVPHHWASSELQLKERLLRDMDAVVEEKSTTIQGLERKVQEMERRLTEQSRELQEKEMVVEERERQVGQRERQVVCLSTELEEQREESKRLRGDLEEVLKKTPEVMATEKIEFWCVSLREVEIHRDKVLGTGAWGVVCEGSFRGKRVAVKCVHSSILQPGTRGRVYREISTMAQLRHPNLVLFMAAVLDDKSGPKIITELLDMSLRSAYEKDLLGNGRCGIFRDVAAALNYLHCLREPIIHRDITSANVLLEDMGGEGGAWKAKVGDFGSANLVRMATTFGEGAIVYTAPEAFPRPPKSTGSQSQPPQTPKMDVYSYGVLLCEVVMSQFPELDQFEALVAVVSGRWPAMHSLITSCIEQEPDRRPSMANVLLQLDGMS